MDPCHRPCVQCSNFNEILLWIVTKCGWLLTAAVTIVMQRVTDSSHQPQLEHRRAAGTWPRAITGTGSRWSVAHVNRLLGDLICSRSPSRKSILNVLDVIVVWKAINEKLKHAGFHKPIWQINQFENFYESHSTLTFWFLFTLHRNERKKLNTLYIKLEAKWTFYC